MRSGSPGPLLNPCRNPGRPVALGPWVSAETQCDSLDWAGKSRQRAEDADAPRGQQKGKAGSPNLAGATLLWAGCAADPVKLLRCAR